VSSNFKIVCRCGGDIRTERLEEIPPPPGALLQIAPDAPEEWSGHQWVCEECGTVCGFSYDYGTLDLGLVRDEDLRPGDFTVFE